MPMTGDIITYFVPDTFCTIAGEAEKTNLAIWWVCYVGNQSLNSSINVDSHTYFAGAISKQSTVFL